MPSPVGVGTPAVKSAALSPVLSNAAERATLVPLVVPGAAAVPAKWVAPPQPTKSITSSRVAMPVAPDSAVWVETRATLPCAPARAIEPSTSAVKPGCEASAPVASPMSTWPPAGTVMPVSGVICHEPPVAEAYCTLNEERSTAASDTFASSMKSRLNAPPLLPPPPYTSEMTTGAPGPAAAWAAGARITPAATVVSTVAIANPRRACERGVGCDREERGGGTGCAFVTMISPGTAGHDWGFRAEDGRQIEHSCPHGPLTSDRSVNSFSCRRLLACPRAGRYCALAQTGGRGIRRSHRRCAGRLDETCHPAP